MIGGQRNGWCSKSMNKPRAASGLLKNTDFRDGVPITIFLTAWFPIGSLSIFLGSLFSVFWRNQCQECQFSLHVQNKQLFCSLRPSLLLEMVSILVGNGSVLHCWQILIFTSAYALNFINRHFGSLFWLLRVPI